MKTLLKSVAFIVVMFWVPALATAETEDDYHPFLSDQFNLDIGYFWPDVDFDLRVNGASPGEEIDFDESVGLSDSQSSGAANFRWRFGEKWSFWGQYWETSSSSSAELTEDLEWEDVVFKAGTFAAGGADLKVVRVFFGREFSQGLNYEFGLGAGLHWLELGAFLAGEIIIDEDTTGFHRANVEAAFPMPNFGGWYLYSWSPKWVFQARLDWLSVEIDEYSGGIWHAQAGINYQAFKNIGLGFYYKKFTLDGDVNKDSWSGTLELDQTGPMITLTATW